MSRYRVVVNIEWTSKCNARCIMCPRSEMPHPTIMKLGTYRQAIDQLSTKDVFRAVIAGYGEPTTHPRFNEFVNITKSAPVPVDMVSNGQLLDETRLQMLDGVLNTLIISFSSIDRQVYERVHANLDHDKVMENILLAHKTLQQTQLAISLTPLSDCIETLPQTIEWLRDNGVKTLTMSPTLYDRAGSWGASDPVAKRLRQIIRQYKLRSQELDFIPSIREIIAQWRANRFKCIPRNTDLVIAADGSYQYCFNDIRHDHPLGYVADSSVRQVLASRERDDIDPQLCSDCNIRQRYHLGEVLRVFFNYARDNKQSQSHC